MAKERDISKLATQVAAKYNRGIDEVGLQATYTT